MYIVLPILSSYLIPPLMMAQASTSSAFLLLIKSFGGLKPISSSLKPILLTRTFKASTALQAQKPKRKQTGTGTPPQHHSLNPDAAPAAAVMMATTSTTIKTQEASIATEKDQKLVHAAVKEDI